MYLRGKCPGADFWEQMIVSCHVNIEHRTWGIVFLTSESFLQPQLHFKKKNRDNYGKITNKMS